MSTWNGYHPFYAGSLYGNITFFGDERKFSNCHGCFTGVCDIEWWVKGELDKLSETEREELLDILKRNYNYSKNIKTREAVSSLAEIIGVDYSVVYRIPANYLNDMLLSESDEEKVKLYSQYCAR
jgi:hypothetical protein